MAKPRRLVAFAVLAAAFGVLDAVWLNSTADPLYRAQLGALMRAESYWIAHITTAVTNDHGYLGKSMASLQDTIDEIEDGEDDDTEEE